MNNKTKITIEALINAPIEKVWECFTKLEHIVNWNFASADWHCPNAVNDFRVGGKFSWRMEAKDGSMGFDFGGIYTGIKNFERINYQIGDGRNVELKFSVQENSVLVTETFEAEGTHSIEQQRFGWQSILNNFKKYVESISANQNKLKFSIEINAPVSIVYDRMLGLSDIKTYQQWTAEFNPSSTYEGNWQKSSEIHFIGAEENGKRGGMVSQIAENIPNKFVSIQHIGILEGDKIIKEGPQVEAWAGAFENYIFEEKNGITVLKVETESNEEFKKYFSTTWPKALAKLKEICEE
ncbi:SRPBCC domain-containing protein [Ignavibacterium sp.]|uniref:SRPBCC domain-containing protein n=1 Tax=Ignavibacterium sp. TaxID=2651167 RepID=UPI00307FBDAF